jgi:hypothetical protein
MGARVVEMKPPIEQSELPPLEDENQPKKRGPKPGSKRGGNKISEVTNDESKDAVSLLYNLLGLVFPSDYRPSDKDVEEDSKSLQKAIKRFPGISKFITFLSPIVFAVRVFSRINAFVANHRAKKAKDKQGEADANNPNT